MGMCMHALFIFFRLQGAGTYEAFGRVGGARGKETEEPKGYPKGQPWPPQNRQPWRPQHLAGQCAAGSIANGQQGTRRPAVVQAAPEAARPRRWQGAAQRWQFGDEGS